MEKQCPQCHSEEIENFDMANLQPDGKPTQQYTDPVRYRCTKCDWEGEIEE